MGHTNIIGPLPLGAYLALDPLVLTVMLQLMCTAQMVFENIYANVRLQSCLDLMTNNVPEEI